MLVHGQNKYFEREITIVTVVTKASTNNTMNQLLPFYILCEHSAIHSGPPSNALAHPTIQYHYADDSPLALWPRHPNERVLVLDYDPTTTTQPTVQSTSKDLAVVSLKVEEAPGAAVADGDGSRSDRMHIIQTTAIDGSVRNIGRCFPTLTNPAVSLIRRMPIASLLTMSWRNTSAGAIISSGGFIPELMD